MCVIMYVDAKRPSTTMVQKAWARNADWGGIAWREPAIDGVGTEVVWRKGIKTAEEMDSLIASLPLPLVAHFRRASCGGLHKSLNHPFPIDKNTSLACEGRTKGAVLFHNGDWKDWDSQALRAAIGSNTQIPNGRWSDSRALAWLCSIYGTGFMEFVPEQKGVAFGPKDIEFFMGRKNVLHPGWKEVDNIWCSNDIFVDTPAAVTYTMCRFPTCTRKDLDINFYCPFHPGGKSVIAAEQTPTFYPPAAPTLPFAQAPPITLEVAEELHKMKGADGKALLSKNLLKKIRVLDFDLNSASQRRKDRAKVELGSISRELRSSGLGALIQSELVASAGRRLMAQAPKITN